MQDNWLALIIGNSRCHWGYFQEKTLEKAWNTPHFSTPLQLTDSLPLYLASVVPAQTELCFSYPHLYLLTLEQIPLLGLYPTLGIDRALAVLGAGKMYGFPCLVIDAGTALTFTGVNSYQMLVGGAILPGLSLQLQMLERQTAALPMVALPESLPPHWANNTSEAIQSGIIYTVLAGIKNFIEDWWELYPESSVILTGGDAEVLLSYFQVQYRELTKKLQIDANLIFWGMRELIVKSLEL